MLNPLKSLVCSCIYALFGLNQGNIVLQKIILAFLHYQVAVVLDVQ